MYNYEVTLTFEFQVYKGQDKENVISDNINHTSSGTKSKKKYYLSSLFLSSTNYHVTKETRCDKKIFEEGVDPTTDNLLKPIKATSNNKSTNKNSFTFYKC